VIRAAAKSALCRALAWSRIEAWTARAEPLVVGYHQVVEDARAPGPMPGLATSVRMLERHLDFLGRRFRFVDLDELAESSRTGGGARPVAAVTFDDGYAGVRLHAAPLLRRKGIPATVFVVTDAIGSNRPFLHDRLHRALVRSGHRRPAPEAQRTLRARPAQEVERIVEAAEASHPPPSPDADSLPLSLADLRALVASGFSVGSHTRTHPLLVGLPDAARRDELEGSRRDLESRLGLSVRHFAYPDGQFDSAVVRSVADAGYRHAYTVCRHRDTARPQLTIPRVMLWERSSLDSAGAFSGAVLDCQTLGAVPLLGRCPRDHGAS